MINAYSQGKDLYAEIAAIAFNSTYEECLEFFPKGTKIKLNKLTKEWEVAKNNESFDKLADGETDVHNAGKARRDQSKRVLLGRYICPV
jgi:hypothetical protein